MKILVATRNNGKIRELRDLLAGLPVELLGLGDFGELADVEETGATFAENALIKASAYARATGIWALSDDSGLEVDALGGAPGVLSARYAGEGASDAERSAKLLAELAATGDAERRARFVCAVAVADDTGALRFAADGVCEGAIAPAPRGTNGFGYDPVFVPDGHDSTFGELGDAVKAQISHRARATRKILGFLRDITAA